MPEQIVREQLPSKKNHVYRDRGTRQDIVTKIFTDPVRFQMEKEIGDLLQNTDLLTPPRLYINESDQVIGYDYIDGVAVVDLIESAELIKAEAIIAAICAWMLKFYVIVFEKKGCQYILGDIHLRNFLYKESSGQLYGFDFEECRPGRLESDAARLYVFILHYEPAFTPRKVALADYFRETFFAFAALDETFFQQEVKRETEELLARRQKRVVPIPLSGR